MLGGTGLLFYQMTILSGQHDNMSIGVACIHIFES